MKINLYENKQVNLKKEPYFFGTARNTQRYDENNFDFLTNIAMTMQRQFWVPEEVKLLKDKLDKESFTVQESHIFDSQLSKLVMLDSYQGRMPLLTFGQLTTNPELEGALLEQTYFEARLHSRSYSYMIENMYTDPDEIFNSSWHNEVLSKHTDSVVLYGNDLYEKTIEYLYKQMKSISVSDEEFYNLKKTLFMNLVSMNSLEGLRFYVGFAAVWAITEFTGKIPGSSRILAFIQRDEKQHLAFTQYLINSLKKTKEFKKIWNEVQAEIYDLYFTVSEEEMEWADYLFNKGSIIGMNAEIGKSYVKYLTNQRLLAIGMKPIYPDSKTLPIKWVNKYINLHNSEQSLQEVEALDYITDPIKHENITDIKAIYDSL